MICLHWQLLSEVSVRALSWACFLRQRQWGLNRGISVGRTGTPLPKWGAGYIRPHPCLNTYLPKLSQRLPAALCFPCKGSWFAASIAHLKDKNPPKWSSPPGLWMAAKQDGWRERSHSGTVWIPVPEDIREGLGLSYLFVDSTGQLVGHCVKDAELWSDPAEPFLCSV